MTSGLHLGIDLGTTGVKVLVVSGDGTVVAGASSHHGIDESNRTGVQADADAWWASVVTALRRLAADVDLSGVEAIGLSGNMSSVVLVDAALRPIAPVLLLADPRGGELLDALPAPLRERIARSSGNALSAVWSLASLLWWQHGSPELLARARSWLSAKDFVRAKLTGAVGTELTDAFNSLLITGGEWDLDLIDALGLPAHLFPPLGRSDAVAGTVTAAAAAETGLPEGVPVVFGAGDVAASLEGIGGSGGDGGFDQGTLVVSLGTSVNMAASFGPDRSAIPANATPAFSIHPDAHGSWFVLGSLLTGGLALNWLRSLSGGGALAPSAEPDELDPLVFLPYLAGTGSPDYAPTATGTLHGIRPATSSADIAAAILEAIAFDLLTLVERLGRERFTRLLVFGGGTRLAAWPQIVADVLQLPVGIVDEAELSALGAALLSRSALEAGSGAETGARTTTGATTSDAHPPRYRYVEPRPELQQKWAVRRERYRALRALLVPRARSSDNRTQNGNA